MVMAGAGVCLGGCGQKGPLYLPHAAGNNTAIIRSGDLIHCMDHFSYRKGKLYAEDVALTAIAARRTPCYVYSRATLERHWRVFDDALAHVPT